VKMSQMFSDSKFNSNISSWDRSLVSEDDFMFLNTRIAKTMGIRDPNFEQVKSYFIALHLEASLQEASSLPAGPSKVRL